ncbi:MAG: HemK family protein methyltransferase, partial [Thermodesulfobacteriota bacterium]
MTNHEAIRAAVRLLSPVLGDAQQSWTEAEILLAHAWKKDRAWVLAYPDLVLKPAGQKKYRGMIRRRLGHEPMAYLVGETNFYGRPFKTDKRALIPRPETEELVEHVINEMKHASLNVDHLSSDVPCSVFRVPCSRRVLLWDVGTGSGAVATTIKAECPDAEVIASDKHRAALSLARANAKRLRVKGIRFYQADLLDQRIRS